MEDYQAAYRNTDVNVLRLAAVIQGGAGVLVRTEVLD